jgi:hypothetical protein
MKFGIVTDDVAQLDDFDWNWTSLIVIDAATGKHWCMCVESNQSERWKRVSGPSASMRWCK